jgi:hypothetical protein
MLQCVLNQHNNKKGEKNKVQQTFQKSRNKSVIEINKIFLFLNVS